MGRAAGALLYLRVTSLKNALQSRLMRLKQPRYLFGAVVGVAYLYFFFLRRFRPGGVPRPGAAFGVPADTLPIAAGLAAMGLTIIAVLYWIGPRARASLSFTEAEIAFLFPAPLGRRTVIQYRLIGLQLGTLVTAVILGLISGTWGFMPGGAAIRIAAWWIILATLSLHIIGSAFVITKWLDRGVTALRRRVIVLGPLSAVIALVALWPGFGQGAPSDPSVAGAHPFIAYLSALLSSGPLYWLSWPARCVVQPLFAHNLSSFAIALGPALLVYAGHYFWVLHVNVAFEEASIERAAKRAERVAALRAGRGLRVGRSAEKARRDPFPLAEAGRPEIAFLWKNLVSSAEYLRPQTALIAAFVITMGCLWLGSHPAYDHVTRTIGFVSPIAAGYLLLFGPMFARQDLRRDLVNADLLKLYPLPAWQIVAGELLTPVVVLSVLVWLLLLATALSMQPPPAIGWLTGPVRAEIGLGIGLATPILAALELVLLNGATLLFPAWLMPTEQRSTRGIEGFGLRIAFLIGLALAIGLALLPTSVPAVIVFTLARWLFGLPVAVVLSAGAVLGVLAVEVVGGVWWLSRRFERFDLSAELRA